MKNEKHRDLIPRTRAYALKIIILYWALPKMIVAQVLGRQLLRSGTSVGAHYREENRAKSTADFISKIEGALRVLDETTYRLDLLSDSDTVPVDNIRKLSMETEELISIFVTVAKSAKRTR